MATATALVLFHVFRPNLGPRYGLNRRQGTAAPGSEYNGLLQPRSYALTIAK
jgi:hypothetical protein